MASVVQNDIYLKTYQNFMKEFFHESNFRILDAIHDKTLVIAYNIII